MKYGFPFLVLFLCFSLALAQSTNATISGGVTDPSGNFIPNAEVEIANDATGISLPEAERSIASTNNARGACDREVLAAKHN